MTSVPTAMCNGRPSVSALINWLCNSCAAQEPTRGNVGSSVNIEFALRKPSLGAWLLYPESCARQLQRNP
eukprot:290633-Amphidinium_carterae.1